MIKPELMLIWIERQAQWNGCVRVWAVPHAQVSNTTFIFIFVIIISSFILFAWTIRTTRCEIVVVLRQKVAILESVIACIQMYICVCNRTLEVMIFAEPHAHTAPLFDTIWTFDAAHTQFAALSSVMLLFLSLVYGFISVLRPGIFEYKHLRLMSSVRIRYIFHIHFWFIFGFPSIFIRGAHVKLINSLKFVYVLLFGAKFHLCRAN